MTINKITLCTMLLLTSLSLSNCTNNKIDNGKTLNNKIAEAEEVISKLNGKVAEEHSLEVLKATVAIVKAKSNPSITNDVAAIKEAKTIISNSISDEKAIDTAIKYVKAENSQPLPSASVKLSVK